MIISGPRASELFAVGRDSGFEVFDLNTSQSLFEVGTFGKSKVLGFTSEDLILVEVEKISGTYLTLYSISSRKFITTIGDDDLPGQPSPISNDKHVYISEDKKIAANNENAGVSIWNLETGERTHLVNTGDTTWLFWLSSSGDKFATIEEDLLTVKLWSGQNGELLSEIVLDKGVYLAGSHENPQLKIWILQAGNRAVAQSGYIVECLEITKR